MENSFHSNHPIITLYHDIIKGIRLVGWLVGKNNSEMIEIENVPFLQCYIRNRLKISVQHTKVIWLVLIYTSYQDKMVTKVSLPYSGNLIGVSSPEPHPPT